jgi:hypothetical protein
MTAPATVADRYIALWNETDADRRRDLLARDWSADATYVDPLMRAQGRRGPGARRRFRRARPRGPPEPGHRLPRPRSGLTNARQPNGPRITPRAVRSLIREDPPTS